MNIAKIILNEQHTLLPQQIEVLNKNFPRGWEIYSVPSKGWSKKEQFEIAEELSKNGLQSVGFVSPVPLLLRLLSDPTEYPNINVSVMHNDVRDKKQFGDKIVFVPAKTGWELI